MMTSRPGNRSRGRLSATPLHAIPSNKAREQAIVPDTRQHRRLLVAFEGARAERDRLGIVDILADDGGSGRCLKLEARRRIS
jgi:hypothetical protein